MDTDGDGISDTDEMVLHGTSPILADTDGDGMSDYEEIVLHAFDPDHAPLRFNPRVADVPSMDVRITSPPLITLKLTATNGETWTYETRQTFERGFALRQSITETDSFSDTFRLADEITKEVSFEFRIDPVIRQETEVVAEEEGTPVVPDEIAEDEGGPAVVLITNAVASTIDRSRTTGVTLSFTAEQVMELREALTFAETYAQSHELSASGGFLEVLVEIHNIGNVPFRVGNLVLSASLVAGDGAELPVGNLDINTLYNQFNPYSLAPGGRQGPVNFSRDFLTLDQVDTLLGDLEALKVRVGVYELLDDLARPYAFDVPAMTSRTATLGIDYGEQRPPERFLVATNLEPARPGVTTKRAFDDVLRIPFGSDSERGLTSVRDVGDDEEGYWSVELRHDDGTEIVTTPYVAPYEFSEIRLRAGDVLHLTWNETESPRVRVKKK